MSFRSRRDAIYSAPSDNIDDFVFDEQVAEVFPDMINRSVPGYATVVKMLGVFAKKYAQPRSRCYDLGCSLGEASLAMATQVDQPDCGVLGVDNSPAMIEAGRRHIVQVNPPVPLKLVCADIEDFPVDNASIVVFNYTLQFIDPGVRQTLLDRIYEGTLPGGILVLSEKVSFENPLIGQGLSELHHAFKKANGYSELEIAQKREALENVLHPETLEAHTARLRSAGYRNCITWFQCFNFASLVCFKPDA